MCIVCNYAILIIVKRNTHTHTHIYIYIYIYIKEAACVDNIDTSDGLEV